MLQVYNWQLDWTITTSTSVAHRVQEERGVIGTGCTRAQEFSGNFPSARDTQCQGPWTISMLYTMLYDTVQGRVLPLSLGPYGLP